MTIHAAGTLTIQNALIFDGKSPDLFEGSITVSEGRITAVGQDAEPASTVVDAGGRTVIPGLIDAHFHAYALSLTSVKNETGPLSYSALAGARRLEAALPRFHFCSRRGRWRYRPCECHRRRPVPWPALLLHRPRPESDGRPRRYPRGQ